jgi:hypothetical protein
VPRGIVAHPSGQGVLVFVFAREATCGSQNAYPLSGDRFFQIGLPWWPNPRSRHIDLWNSDTLVNIAERTGGSGRSESMGGSVDVVSTSPSGGAIVVHARNDRGALEGQVPFVVCP